MLFSSILFLHYLNGWPKFVSLPLLYCYIICFYNTRDFNLVLIQLNSSDDTQVAWCESAFVPAVFWCWSTRQIIFDKYLLKYCLNILATIRHIICKIMWCLVQSDLQFPLYFRGRGGDRGMRGGGRGGGMGGRGGGNNQSNKDSYRKRSPFTHGGPNNNTTSTTNSNNNNLWGDSSVSCNPLLLHTTMTITTIIYCYYYIYYYEDTCFVWRRRRSWFHHPYHCYN